jgi:hypothetical protein
MAVADTGVDAFRAAWAELPKERRALVTDRMEDFKNRALAADKAVQEAAE